MPWPPGAEAAPAPPAPMPRSVRLTSRAGLSCPRSQHRAAWCGRVQPMAGLSPRTLRHLLHPGWDGSKPDPRGHTAGPERSHTGSSMTTCLRLALQPQPRTSGPAGDSWPETQGGWWGPGLGAGSPSQLVAEGGEGPQGPAGGREWLEPGEGPGPGQSAGARGLRVSPASSEGPWACTSGRRGRPGQEARASVPPRLENGGDSRARHGPRGSARGLPAPRGVTRDEW